LAALLPRAAQGTMPMAMALVLLAVSVPASHAFSPPAPRCVSIQLCIALSLPLFSLLPPPHSMSLTQLSLPFVPLNCLSCIFLYLRARLSCEITHSYVARLVHSHLSLYSAALYVCGCPRIQRLPTATATETYVIHMCHLCSVHSYFSHNVFCY